MRRCKTVDDLKDVADIMISAKPDILAMSALLTTTAAEQRDVVDTLSKEGRREQIKVIVGGGAINQEFADSIGADGYGANAPEGVIVAKRLLGI